LACPHFFHNITGISLAPANDGKNAELQYPLFHLALRIFNVHGFFFSLAGVPLMEA
jgi:hypothetical protein